MKRTNFMIATFGWLASVIVGCLPVAAQSTMPGVIFSDYGPNMGISATAGWCVSGASSPDCGPRVPRWVASPFIPTNTSALMEIKLALGYSSGTNGAVINLTNGGNGVPGSTVLESWTATNLSSSTNNPLLSLKSVVHPTLHAGTEYWLVAMGSAGDTLDFWWDGATGTGSLESNNSGSSWYTLPGLLTAFEVLGGCQAKVIHKAIPPNSVSGLPTQMLATFSPQDSLTTAAATCGYKTFDWQQTIQYWPPDSPLEALRSSPACPPPSNFCLAPFFDPPPGGYTYFLLNPALYAGAFEAYPFYYAPSALLFGCAAQDPQSGDCLPITSVDDKTLTFFDAPKDPLLLPFEKGMQFTTSLVGVTQDNTVGKVLDQWSWTSTYNPFINTGGIQSMSAQTVDGNGTGGITITDINGVPQTPPTTTCSATPNTLWPPNGEPVVVTVSGSITAGTSSLVASTYKVIDSYGQAQPAGNITLTGGAYSFDIPLMAARNGDDLDGRTYTIVVAGSDTIGNVGACSAVVTVPHDQSN